jgi:tRNA 2-thiocytidine biosynthesis protein TtcA
MKKAGAERVVEKLCLKAVLERKLLAPGDRILVAVSGGKDSTVLAWALSKLAPALKFSCHPAPDGASPLCGGRGF